MKDWNLFNKLLEKLAALARRLGKLPTIAEMKLEKRDDPSFPSHNSLLKANRDTLQRELRSYCEVNTGYEDVLKFLSPILVTNTEVLTERTVKHGYVYLLSSGKRYKIGYSIAALSRAAAISNMTPDGAVIEHLIRTDDPRGIESYWHNRFAAERGNSEWFALSSEQVRIFKRRKFM